MWGSNSCLSAAKPLNNKHPYHAGIYYGTCSQDMIGFIFQRTTSAPRFRENPAIPLED